MNKEKFESLTEEQKDAWAKKMRERDRLKEEVYELYTECELFDDGVDMYFDPESDRMLEKKKRVLKSLIDGNTPDEIGKDYFDILEEFDQGKVKDGETAEVGDWVFDPKKYK